MEEEKDIRSEARELLTKIEDLLPFKVNEVTSPEDLTVIATIRNAAGYPVLAPHPESISLLTGDRSVFEFVVFAPRIIRGLLDELEGQAVKD